jgi:hypothetical protein
LLGEVQKTEEIEAAEAATILGVMAYRRYAGDAPLLALRVDRTSGSTRRPTTEGWGRKFSPHGVLVRR